MKEEKKLEREYLSKVKSVLTSSLCSSRTSQGVAQLLDYLYIGNKQDANKFNLLKVHKITHVLNCAAEVDYDSGRFGENPYVEHGIEYEQFEARDVDSYPILMHYHKAKRFINKARDSGGRVLVHCEMGINRSGAICIAYMMLEENMTLLHALRMAKMERPVLLVNESFQKQLITLARENELLYKEKAM